MLSISSTSMTILEQKTNLELSKLKNWLRNNKLTLNLSKTKLFAHPKQIEIGKRENQIRSKRYFIKTIFCRKVPKRFY